jgi:hypothetical protein
VTPARRMTAIPRPLTEGLGSAIATTTCRTPDCTTAGTHGGVRLRRWQQGSSVTYSVAPLACGPAWAERKNFCVGLPWTVVIPAADDAAVLDHDGADHGIRTGLALALRRKTKRQGHEVEVRCGGSHRFLRVTRDRLRGR